MFLMVSERTREIGIRMTVGAKPWHIRLQIALETVVIILLGGGVGFFIAFLIIAILQNALLPEWLGHPEFSYFSGVMTIIILLILGMLSGYFPAERASKLDPVEAVIR
jgi:ABC-type antimicrobial peptide transport system permease subunit